MTIFWILYALGFLLCLLAAYFSDEDSASVAGFTFTSFIPLVNLIIFAGICLASDEDHARTNMLKALRNFSPAINFGDKKISEIKQRHKIIMEQEITEYKSTKRRLQLLAELKVDVKEFDRVFGGQK